MASAFLVMTHSARVQHPPAAAPGGQRAGLGVAATGPNRPSGAHARSPCDGRDESAAETVNWSGYVDTGPTFTAISAQWVVPTVHPSQSAQYSSTWIGIDGIPMATLPDPDRYGPRDVRRRRPAITTGTRSSPRTSPAKTIGTVSPGDHMTASVYEVTAGTWMIAITDVTSGSVFSQPFAYSGTGSFSGVDRGSPYSSMVPSRPWPTSALLRSPVFRTPTLVRRRLLRPLLTWSTLPTRASSHLHRTLPTMRSP